MSRHVIKVRLREMVTIYGVHGTIELFLPASHSLKERRRVVNSVKSRLQSHFNISVVETSDDHLWQKATLGFALVSSNFSGLQNTLEAIDRHLGNNSEFEVMDLYYEYIALEGTVPPNAKFKR